MVKFLKGSPPFNKNRRFISLKLIKHTKKIQNDVSPRLSKLKEEEENEKETKEEEENNKKEKEKENKKKKEEEEEEGENKKDKKDMKKK